MIYLAIILDGYLGRGAYDWLGLDLDAIVDELQSRGLAARAVALEDLHRVLFAPTDRVWYSCNRDPEIIRYTIAHLHFLRGAVSLLPSFDHLLCFENKGAQQLLRDRLGLDDLAGDYRLRPRDIGLPYPYALKTVDGAGGSGVFRIASDGERQRTAKRLATVPLKARIRNLVRKRRMAPDARYQYLAMRSGLRQVVGQSFVEGLRHDYKVIVCGRKYFVLRRDVRAGDFRASGSGSFASVTEPMPDLLDAAQRYYTLLDAPCLSLDIAIAQQGPVLIEFQAIAFGPIAITRSPGYFALTGDQWEFTAGLTQLEQALAGGVADYLEAAGPA